MWRSEEAATGGAGGAGAGNEASGTRNEAEGPCAGNETGKTGFSGEAGGEAGGKAGNEAEGSGVGSKTGDIGAGYEAKVAGAGNEIDHAVCGMHEDRVVVFDRHGQSVSMTLP